MKNNTLQPDPEKLQYIVDCLPTEELLAQLAEEASELAQAALKLRRVEDGTNPARISKEDAIKNLLKEIADVKLSIHLLGFDNEKSEEVCQEIIVQMTEREQLLQILNIPIHPHLDVDLLEAVADFLLDNGVKIPVRCKACKHRADLLDNGNYLCNRKMIGMVRPNDFCSFGERRTDD